MPPLFMRFFLEHPSEHDRLALVSIVTQGGYKTAVRQAAEAATHRQCHRQGKHGRRRSASGMVMMRPFAIASDNHLGRNKLALEIDHDAALNVAGVHASEDLVDVLQLVGRNGGLDLALASEAQRLL